LNRGIDRNLMYIISLLFYVLGPSQQQDKRVAVANRFQTRRECSLYRSFRCLAQNLNSVNVTEMMRQRWIGWGKYG
jgi:hypothetical protein